MWFFEGMAWWFGRMMKLFAINIMRTQSYVERRSTMKLPTAVTWPPNAPRNNIFIHDFVDSGWAFVINELTFG